MIIRIVRESKKIVRGQKKIVREQKKIVRGQKHIVRLSPRTIVRLRYKTQKNYHSVTPLIRTIIVLFFLLYSIRIRK